MNLKLFILIVFFLKIYAVSAQKTLTGSDAEIAKQAANKSIRSQLSSPFGASSLPNFFSNVSLSSFFKEGVNGKIELQGKLNSGLSGGLSIDQKIGKSDTKATPLDLSGISPGTTVEFNLQKMLWHPKFNLSNKQVSDLNDAVKAYADRKSDISKGIKVDWRSIGLREISLYGTKEEKELAVKAFNTVSFKSPLFINVRAGFTKTSFSYSTDSLTLKENNEIYLTPTLTLSIIKALGQGFSVTGYAALSYNYAESYNAADDITFNIPFGTTANFYTRTLAFGKPGRQVSHNIIGEYRRNLFTANNTNIAISPSATFSINNNRLSAFLPVYFTRGADDKGKLIDGLKGGIRFGYITSTESGRVSSFKNGFIAQLIISQPLDFLDRL